MNSFFKPGLLALLGLWLYGSPAATAQVNVQVQVGRPAWGPPIGPGVQYYYIPEIDGYYDLYTQQYVYLDPYGYWVSTPYLPPYYASYDPRFFHPVVVQYVGRQPWGYIGSHRAYCGQRGWQPGYYRGNRGGYGYGYHGGYRNGGGNRYPDGRSYGYNNPHYAPTPGPRPTPQPNGYNPGRPNSGPGGFGQASQGPRGTSGYPSPGPNGNNGGGRGRVSQGNLGGPRPGGSDGSRDSDGGNRNDGHASGGRGRGR